MKERKPIFYDAEKVRWRRTRRILEVSGAALTLLLVYFFLTIAGSVELPSSLLPDTRPVYHSIKKKVLKPVSFREGRRKRVADIGQIPATYDPLRAAFFVSWDPNSLASLKKHYKDIDLLMPEQLHAVTPDGAITVVDYERNQTVPVSPMEALSRLQQDKLHQWMRSTNPPVELPMMGLLNNYDGAVWQVKAMGEMLAKPDSRAHLVRDATQFAVMSKEAGIVLDFEEVPEKSQENFQKFVGELAPALHAVGLKLMIALPARDDEYDYEYFGKVTDAIIVMNYDQHWLTSDPGPIAAQDWFMENLRQLRDVVPAQKLVVGIANYAYDWTETAKKEPPHAEEFSIQEALLHAYESEAEMEFDPASLNPHYSYSDEQNHTHQVWLLDAVTAYNELRGSERLGVQGTALWRLGSSDTSLWPIWDSTRPDDATRAKIADIPPGPDLILEGDGDIWHITDVPKQGRRSFTYDSSLDQITSEKYEAYPLSYDIDEIGGVKGKVVLSFDDGPDRRWTPKILDILKEKQVPGVFFVIGDQANRAPDLLKREYDEGHEIGNHTFTHPPFTEDLSHTQVRWELNLTQRLIESTLGVKSLLFRPPFGIDHQPEYAEEVAPLPYPQELGYIIVGQRIDPRDWYMPDNQHQMPADEIVAEVMKEVSKGNIILFHDGGGDRSQTIAALPQVIDQLRAKGYQFVSVGDLLGKQRADLMVPLSFRERMAAHADGFIFSIFQWSRFAIATIFILGIVLVSGRAAIIGLLAIIEKLRPDTARLREPSPGVTVLIPAHNEESVIVQTVQSVLLSDLDNIRVIVVDDGSKDQTLELLQLNFGRNDAVDIIHQVNQGKAAALNNALSRAQTEIVVTIDADTEIESDAIRKLLRHFSDPSVGAVAGNVKVGNRSRWLTRWQALEYITSQNMEKRAFDLLNCITVVPGALGAWRKEAIEAGGGITADTVAEDADLTIAIRRLGWRVTYDEEAIAWTEAPETPGQLIRQRFRWTFGTLQSFWKHSDTLFRPKYGTLGWIALPNIFIFQIVLPLVSPILDLLFLGSLVLWGLAGVRITQIPHLWTTADVQRSVVFFLGFLIIDVMTCVVAFALERHEDWTLLIPVLLQRFYYRQLMYIVLFRSVKEAVSGRPVGWKGVEKEPPATPEPVTP